MDGQSRASIPRPESTVAQSFAAELEGMFGLSPNARIGALPQTHSEADTEALHQTVQQKKSTVSQKDRELQELEAQLRATEARLARASRTSSPARQPTSQAHTGVPTTPPSRAPPSPSSSISASVAAGAPAGASRPSPLAQKPTYPPDRPPTASAAAASSVEQQRPQAPRRDDTAAALMRGMPGAMPETPRQYSGNGNGGDYVMVDKNGYGGRGGE